MTMGIHVVIIALAAFACSSCSRETADKRSKESQPVAAPVADNSVRRDTVPIQPDQNKAVPPADVFLPILQDAKKQTRLPVLLPSDLPSSYGGLVATLAAEPDKYSIGLITEPEAGRYAAGFLAEKEENYIAADIGNTKHVTLAKNTLGFFRPISCGGSCSPVNLWWEQSGILYNIQAVMSSDTSEDEQERFIVPIADSAILGGPR
jgi:hypothetical protein